MGSPNLLLAPGAVQPRYAPEYGEPNWKGRGVPRLKAMTEMFSNIVQRTCQNNAQLIIDILVAGLSFIVMILLSSKPSVSQPF